MILTPWNISWTAEDAYEIRPCRYAGGKLALWSPHRPGEGKPIFAKPHMVRQRKSIAEMRCTVCGEQTGPGYFDRWWFRMGNQIEGGWFATVEAPLHRACANLAMRVCPHIRANGFTPEPFPHGASVICSIIGGPETERDFGVKIRDREVIGPLKLAWPVLPLTADQRGVFT